MEWITTLAGRIKVKTMKQYLTGLRSYHVDLGLPAAAFQNERLERVIRGSFFPILKGAVRLNDYKRTNTHEP